MAIKSGVKRRKRVAFIILLVLSILWMLPLLWALGTSFKSANDMRTNVITIIPREFTFGIIKTYLKIVRCILSLNGYEIVP